MFMVLMLSLLNVLCVVRWINYLHFQPPPLPIHDNKEKWATKKQLWFQSSWQSLKQPVCLTKFLSNQSIWDRLCKHLLGIHNITFLCQRIAYLFQLKFTHWWHKIYYIFYFSHAALLISPNFLLLDCLLLCWTGISLGFILSEVTTIIMRHSNFLTTIYSDCTAHML